MPCNDRYDSIEESTSLDINDTDHERHHHESTTCSPFCFCACCGSVYIPILIPQYFPILKELLIGEICEYKNGYIQNIYFNIWQPPKV